MLDILLLGDLGDVGYLRHAAETYFASLEALAQRRTVASRRLVS